MSLDLLHRMADHIPSMLAYWDRELRCRYANRAYRDWFGVEPGDLIGRTLPQLLGPELFAKNEPFVRGALAGREQQFERDVPGPAGVKRSLAHYLPDWQDGQVAGFIAYVTDVSPLKLAQDRLRAARRRTARAALTVRRRAAGLREAQRVGQIGSWEWLFDGDRVTWSAELCRIFGLDPGQPAPPYAAQAALYVPESWQLLQGAVARTLADGTPYELELAFRHPDGSQHWIEARGEALRQANGQIVGLRGTAHDITWRRTLEEARIRAQVAESASRHKTALLSRASHELRTPLNAILGFGQLLQHEAVLPPQQRRWLDQIVDSGGHMLALSEDLLDIAAAESGGMAIASEVVDLQAVAQGAIEALSHEAHKAQLTVQFCGAPVSLRLAQADPARTRQIAMNLLSNAIKYGRPGPTIAVSIGTDAEGMRCLHVQDSGRGLSDAQLQQLFKPFQRLGAEHTPVRGVGLGLAVSQQLAELMGGRIEVQSRPGEGSRFTLVLPAATVTREPPAAIQPATS
ncbi:ATP-binding protein [Aquabacterium sp.]|uniref:sensor histidine kinase n=1 Tax=Aquabacterium sp. TaxID=1872578 RepID=UPI003783EA56